MSLILILSILMILLLGLKCISLKKSVRKLRADFLARGDMQTNARIGTNSGDKDIKALATAMNDANDKLAKAYHLYEQGNQEMQTAITNISHDLRTPLTAISGYLELCKPLEKSKELERYLTIIGERTKRMKHLTEELFVYSVLNAKTEEDIEWEEVDLNRAIEDCIMEYYGALMEKQIDLQVDMTEERIVRKLGKAEVDRIFSNLISNALKYSEGDLKISLDQEGTIRFINRTEKVSPLVVERLFGRFYTVENARNSTGLGLSIAKALVERMGGTIDAQYENGSLHIILQFPAK